MFQKILATSVLVTLLATNVLAQEAPGKSLPVVSETAQEETLIFNSAPSDPGALTLSEIAVEPQVSEAVLTFTTSQETHVIIEYGLTPDYDHSISTEPQTEHSEMIGELTACAKYYYRVYTGDVSREGVFETQCPVVKKVAKPVAKPVVKKVAKPAPVVPETIKDQESTINNEEEIVLNAAPEVMPEPVNNDVVTVEREPLIEDEILIEQPETPAMPQAVQVVEEESSSSLPLLLVLALLSGAAVVGLGFKKKKKWYQR